MSVDGQLEQQSLQALIAGLKPEQEVLMQLARCSVVTSLAYAEVLAETGCYDEQTVKAVTDGLLQIQKELLSGPSFLASGQLNVQSGLKARLRELIGEASAAIDLKRSTWLSVDMRLCLRNQLLSVLSQITALRAQMLSFAQRDSTIVMPGYLHWQTAEPVLFSFWWLANERLLRIDFARFNDYFKRLNCLPAGPGAAGAGRQAVFSQLLASRLNFNQVLEPGPYNGLDLDYLLEAGSLAALLAVHTGQMAGDLLLWATAEFGFISLPKGLLADTNTGKNSEIALLQALRLRSSRISTRVSELYSAFNAVLPGTYQLSQACLQTALDMVDDLKLVLSCLHIILPAVHFNSERMQVMASADPVNAGNALDYLVAGGMSHERAIKVVNELVNYCQQRHKYLCDLELNEWQQFSPAFDEQIYKHIIRDAGADWQATLPQQAADTLSYARQAWERDCSAIPGAGQVPEQELENF